MSNKMYDILKAIALVVLPATATLVIAIFKIWGLPYGAEIGATITAVATFLGSIITVSSAKYKAENKNELGDAITKQLVENLKKRGD